MSQKQPCFVFDTNVLLDFNIIPKKGDYEEEEILIAPTVNFNGAHLIIPTAVVRELAKFKKESSKRGAIARMLLKRLRDLFENSTTGVLYDSYRLKQPQTIRIVTDTDDGETCDQLISIMPLHKNFCDNLPFHPSDDDMDGQIILTAIAVACLEQSLEIDGTAPLDKLDFSSSDVTLLTNDNEMAIRANARGVRTSRFGYQLPPLRTCRRDLEVPAELLEKFFNGYSSDDRAISLEEWRDAMPDQADFIANEFIIMHNEKAQIDNRKLPWNHIGRYDVNKNQIRPLEFLDIAPDVEIKSDGQAIYMEALMNPSITTVICIGPAGSGKTYLSTIRALTAIQDGNYIDIAVVPCQPENKNGYLPGDLKEKMSPIVQPTKNAIRSYLLKTDYREELASLIQHGLPANGNKTPLMQRVRDRADELYDHWFGTPIPVSTAQGLSFDYTIVLLDEFQDHSMRDADMLLKRTGEHSKVVITGDIAQVHAAYLDENNNGLTYAIEQEAGDPEVAIVSLEPDDIVRSEIVKRLAERQRRNNSRAFQGDVEESKAPNDATDASQGSELAKDAVDTYSAFATQATNQAATDSIIATMGRVCGATSYNVDT